MFSNRRPYYGLKLSIADFFREPVRYLKQSNTQESMLEKPYLVDEYPKMHLNLPGFQHKPKERPGFSRPIAVGAQGGGVAYIDFGEADCHWEIVRAEGCLSEPIIITMSAEHFFHAEFDFVAQIAKDTIGVTLSQLPGTEAFGWDDQDYKLTFPEDASGSVTICGFASTNTLISQTFEVVVAGMPVGLRFVGGGLTTTEHGQQGPASLLKSSYGTKGANCGCIEISSDCEEEEEECSCTTESIGYTTQQMSVDEVQTLTVTDSVGECVYDWEISSGGGSLSSSTGTSVDYTAPSANAECASNPTITLSVGGDTCDALQIAVNAVTGWDEAYRQDCPTESGYCILFGGKKQCVRETESYRCNGLLKPGGCSYHDPAVCGGISCSIDSECSGCSVGTIDMRSPSMKTAGCCPAALL